MLVGFIYNINCPKNNLKDAYLRLSFMEFKRGAMVKSIEYCDKGIK